MDTEPAHGKCTPLLTLSEVSAIFGVEPTVVTQWVSAGKLIPVLALAPRGTRSREWCFAESQVRELINGAVDRAPDVFAVWRWAGGVHRRSNRPGK